MKPPVDCPCHVCRPKPARMPGVSFGLNAHGDFDRQNTYYPQLAEARWERRIKRLAAKAAEEANDVG